MRRLIIYIITIVLLCFIIPILFTEKFATTNQVVGIIGKEEENINYQKDENKNGQSDKKSGNTEEKEANINAEYVSPNIKVYFKKEDEVKEISLEEYLYGVVSAEMPASYDIEALKAQAVVARTYTLYKIEHNADKHGEAAICTDSTCCQAWISKEDRFSKWEELNREEYWNKIITAVDSTKGIVATYNGNVINAFFHANSGGKTELPVNVWGGSGYPYLQSVETSGENEYSQYESEVEFTKEELLERLHQKYNNVQLELDDIEILERFESGRIKTIKFGNIEIAGVEARTILGLRSANFDITVNDNKIKFTVYGYGHGVGMSQTGADSLAKNGMNYVDIIKHFYTGVDIIQCGNT